MATKHDLLSTLRSVQAGSISPEEALLQMKLAPFEDLGYAKVDYHRAVRQGASEVIYGQSKTPEHIAGILEAMQRRDSTNILVTRIEQKTADWLAERFPCAMSRWQSWRWSCRVPQSSGARSRSSPEAPAISAWQRRPLLRRRRWATA